MSAQECCCNSHLDSAKVFGVVCFSDAKLWHFRLGHLAFEQLQYIGSENCNNSRQHVICQVYPLAKMHRSGFPLNISRAKQCFDLIHIHMEALSSYHY